MMRDEPEKPEYLASLVWDLDIAKGALHVLEKVASREFLASAKEEEQPVEEYGEMAEKAEDLIGFAEDHLSAKTHSDRSLDMIALCAARYAMGRKSYIVGEVTAFLEEHWGLFAEETRRQIQDDIERRLEDESYANVVHDNPERRPPRPLGQDVDREQWLGILELPTER